MHALYPISGNPPTWGHADIVARAARIFDEVTWALAFNPNKTYAVSIEDRQEMMGEYVRHLNLNNVSVEAYQGPTVRHAERIGAGVILKGLRNQQDMVPEMEQAFGNRGMNANIETLLMFTHPKNAHISSSLIRELIALGENVDEYVLPPVARKMREAMGIKG